MSCGAFYRYLGMQNLFDERGHEGEMTFGQNWVAKAKIKSFYNSSERTGSQLAVARLKNDSRGYESIA